jgi:hypothetical protein
VKTYNGFETKMDATFQTASITFLEALHHQKRFDFFGDRRIV